MPGIGYAAVSVAAVMWAASASVASRLFDRGASPLEVVAARAWLAAIGIGAILLVRRRLSHPRAGGATPPGARGLLAAVPFGVSIAGANYFYYFAVSRLPVAIAIVIQYTAPGLVVAWGALARGRRPTRRMTGALGLALAGVALLAELPSVIARGELRLDGAGVAAAAGSAICFSAYMLTGERLGRAFGPDGALFRGFCVAGVVWAFVLVPRGRPDTLLDSSFLPGILTVAVFGTIVPFLLFVWGLGRIGAERAAIASTLEPASATLIAWVWLGQSLGGMQLAGAAMVIAGIAIVQAERAPAPEVLAERAALE